MRCSSEDHGALRGTSRSSAHIAETVAEQESRSKNITILRIMSAARLKLPRSRTVYYGIEESPVIEGSLIPPASDSIHIAYVGRLVAEKGPALLLEAAPALSLRRGVRHRPY